jgi:hypothetical protein
MGATLMRTALKNRWVWVALIAVVAITWAGVGHNMRRASGAGFGGAPQREEEPEPTPKVVHVSTPVTPEAARTWIALGKPIAMPFPDETPLEDVLKYIKAATSGPNEKGIKIYVVPIGLQEAEKTMQSTIVLDLDGVPLSTSLRLLLKQINLRYFVDKDGILVITAESDEPETVSDPFSLMLNQLSALRSELAALRREMAEMKRAK